MKDGSTIKWIAKKSKKQNLKMFLLILANVVFSVLSVVFAFAIKKTIDGAVVKDKNLLIFGAVALGVIVILQFAFRLIINGLTEHIRARLDITFRSDIFSSILGKKYSTTKAFHSGELINRLSSDVSIVTDGVTSILPSVVSAIARLLSAVVALIILDPVFAIAFTVAGAMVFAVLGLLRGKLKNLHKKAQETDGKTRSFMQECIENLLAIKVFDVNEKVEGESKELQEENFKVRMKRRNYSILGHATYNFIFSAGYLFALIYGGVKIFTGVAGFGYGDLSAVLQLVNNVQVPFMSLSGVLPKYYGMLASAERLMEIEDLEDEPEKTVIDFKELYAKTKAINFEGVTFTYDRDKVLDGAAFTINKGDFVAITGLSGIGKSTLMKLMLGVYPLDDGSIYFDTANGKICLDNSTRGMFSYVPQGNMLFSGTIKDNVTFVAKDKTEEEINLALKNSCADEFIGDLPNGLDTIVGEKGVGLSEGQIQRIAIARALLCDSPIILLDEATSALDEQTELKLLSNLKALDGVTLVIISHKKAALDICNKHLLISEKKVLEI
ncbi:MAG: ABC transporter ATP-binding protein [Clostridiales bacterium]|nr:ABC transporter ATP-binding protein [Clostridiales bacterium]